MNSLRLLSVGALLAVAACASRPDPAPPGEPQPPAPQIRPQAPLPPPPPAAADWRDMPLTPGNWYYQADGSGSRASYGASGAASFVVRCDRAGRRIALSRPGAAAGAALTIRTTSSARNIALAAEGGAATASLLATDRFLDDIAFSRGRFTVEAPGVPMLVVPAWPELARVVEDCRA